MTKVDYTFERRMKLNYDEGREDGIKIGEQNGIKIGEKNGIKIGEKNTLLNQISKKLSKNKSIAQIADELEESESTILELSKELSN